MSNVIRLAIVDPSDSARETLKNSLLGIERIWLEAECSRYEFFTDVIGQTEPEMALIALDSDPEKAIKLITTLHETTPKTSILAISASNDGSLILRTMRAGAREFLTSPMQVEELLSALDRVHRQFHSDGETRGAGSTVVAVCGATGGVGTTSVAVNLACYLAQEPNRSVALVDLDLCLGDADVLLDTIPEYTLVDVAQNATRLDFTLLRKSLTKHSSGVFLLPRPVDLQDVELVTEDDLNRVFGLLKATFTHLVIDTSKAYSRLDRVALNVASHIMLVSQLDLPCLRNVVRLMSSFKEIEGMEDKVKIVMNRVGLNQGQISLKKAQDTIGREIFWQLPNDYQVMVGARNNGVPLVQHAPKSALGASYQQLAHAISGGGTPQAELENSKSIKSLLGGILSGRGKAPVKAES